ncbi:hypothetical protein [Mariniflexile rhizosphaerae]|uniref:hypothetical protein n=1 Tax=unclassified Mariniflexile TaxID=2643887 RepID=UPI000CB3D5CA|nr:hypothetical protein [Mariniflexile sp. TRM1-10]PLB20063.1 MAG: Cell well associated RhsD protein [Flavobacteriaceae bacterium FS1-H7996/R]
MSTYTAFDNNPVFWADPSGADAQDIWGRDRFDSFSGVYIPPMDRGPMNSGQQPPGGETLLQKVVRTTVTSIANKANELSGGEMGKSASDKHVNAYQLFYQWVHGTGSSTRNFDENSIMGKEMLQAPEVIKAINNAAKLSVCNDDCNKQLFFRSLKSENPITYALDDFPKDIGGRNPARGFHGSFSGTIMVNDIIPANGGSWVKMTVSISDRMTAESGTRLSGTAGGYDKDNPATVYPKENPYGANGQFRTININYKMEVSYFQPK